MSATECCPELQWRFNPGYRNWCATSSCKIKPCGAFIIVIEQDGNFNVNSSSLELLITATHESFSTLTQAKELCRCLENTLWHKQNNEKQVSTVITLYSDAIKILDRAYEKCLTGFVPHPIVGINIVRDYLLKCGNRELVDAWTKLDPPQKEC